MPGADWAFEFPHAVDPDFGLRRARWDDVRQVLGAYFRDQTDGTAFDAGVQSIENQAHPDELVAINVANVGCVNGRVWKETADAVQRVRLPELVRIPETADLFASSRFDDAVVAMVERLDAVHRVDAAVATKFLCQKRPALIPMLDSLACPVLGVPTVAAGEKVRRALSRLRELTAHPANAETLERLRGWLGGHRPIQTHVGPMRPSRLSTLRTIDILAWMKGKELSARSS